MMLGILRELIGPKESLLVKKNLEAEHGIICRLNGERFSYFGWPTIARMEDGELVVTSSGFRTQHIDPWGKTVLITSLDDGMHWSSPQVLNDTVLDDRDSGIICLGGKKRLLSWIINGQPCWYRSIGVVWHGEDEVADWLPTMSNWTQEMQSKYLGTWIRVSEDGIGWSDPMPAPLSNPHGPIKMRNGDLLFFGKLTTPESNYLSQGPIQAWKSTDCGKIWVELGTAPNCRGTVNENYHEPHVVETPSGKLVGLIRFEEKQDFDAQLQRVKDEPIDSHFSLYQTDSDDGGITWSQARPLGVEGSPPHLLAHSSGALVCVYGSRRVPYGQRVMISRDEGTTWDSDYVLRDDGPDADLGYPSSVELADGQILTAYYQKIKKDENPSLLWSRWSLS